MNMITKLYRQLHLKINPIEVGDVFYADCMDFDMGRMLTQIRHGLRNHEGTLNYTFWNGDNTYRITILSTSTPYYILTGEVLTRAIDKNGQFEWMKRSQRNRIGKEQIHNMILEGKLTRSKI